MHLGPRLLAAGAICALVACNQSSPGKTAGEARQNVAAAPPAANASAPVAAGPTEADAAHTASGNGLWDVAEAEDEASHRGIDFVAFNRTGQAMTGLAIRPDEGPLAAGAAEAPWSANVLSQRELPDGQRAAAHFEADIELCRWQLRATFADRKTRDYPSVNLCDTIRVDLR